MWTANTRTTRQLALIRALTTTLTQGRQRAWLFGGWGLDARIGRVTRDHCVLRRRPDGTFTPRGRFDDWLFPRGSFPDEPVELAGQPVRAMSLAGMLAMKEQFPNLRNGRPWRDKDVSDIKILRSMLENEPST